MSQSKKTIFVTLFFSIFSAVMGVGIVVPLLPVYAMSIGAGGFYVALIFGSFSLSRTIMLPIFGSASDRNGRRPYLVTGLIAYVLISFAFIFIKSVNGLIGVRFIQGIASAMIMPSAQAYIADITPAGKEGSIMGLFNLSVFAGLSIGPLIGGVINDYWGMDPAFLSMGVLAFIGYLLCILYLPPTKAEKVFSQPHKQLGWFFVISDRELAGLFVFRLMYTFCIGIIWCFLPVYASSEFLLSSSQIGILVTLAVFVSGLLNAPMGYLADRINKVLMVVLGGIFITYAIYGYILSDTFYGLFISNFLFGVGGGVSMPALMAMAVLKGNEMNAMGSIMAIMTMAHSLGMLLGAIAAGLAMDYLGLQYAFPLGSIMMGLGVLFFSICVRKRM
ncbi:MAG: MFS transporter [Pseudomonadota bacterium]